MDRPGGDKFSDYRFGNYDGSSIAIGSRYIRILKGRGLATYQHLWIQGMAKKYEFTRLKIIEEADVTIDGHPAFWSVVRYERHGETWKEKIYLVKGYKCFYRLRISCPQRYFDKHLVHTFEPLVKSFRLLEKEPHPHE